MNALDALNRLSDHKSLKQAQSYGLFNDIFHGRVKSAPLGALLIGFKMKGETADEIAGAASAMIANAIPFDTPDYAFADIVGTGGDGHNTINISSASALVASACGVKVAKHGNRSVSSKSGSSELYNSMGINIEMTAVTARRCLDQAGFTFLHAPIYHTGMKYVMPVRLQLKTRTLFNVLGPLANPAGPSHSLLGVYDPKLLEIYSETMMLLGQHRTMVVHGSGLDELALHGPSTIFDLEHGDIRRYDVTPKDFGLKSYPIEAIKGDTPEINRQLILDVLSGEGKEAHCSAIAMNCGALLVLTGKVETFKQGAELAMSTMREGKAIDVIETACRISQEGNN